MSEFLDGLDELLNQVGKITRDERDRAESKIKQAYRKSVATSEGLCIVCRKTQIVYGVCKTHATKGDGWLKNHLRPKFKKGPGLKYDRYKGWTLNGYHPKTVDGYICDPCWDQIVTDYAALDKLRRQKEEEQYHRQQIENREKDFSILENKKKATIPQRYRALCRRINPAFCSYLQSLSYQDFLRSFYWDVVRKYKLHKADFQCELCSNKGETLNVHHKTYDHHGYEHQYLEDLIVLCRTCHERHHNIVKEAPVVYHTS